MEKGPTIVTNPRLVLPTLLTGLGLALAIAGYQVWVRAGVDAAASPGTERLGSPDILFDQQGEAEPVVGHDCDSQDHAAMMGDQTDHQEMMGGNDDRPLPADASDHDSMMQEHHGNNGGGQSGGMMGGGT